MTQMIELFENPTGAEPKEGWRQILKRQWCPYLDRKCLKVRKSQPHISIGTCSVLYGKDQKPLIICPFRLLERRQIFTDCLHLLALHEAGNELHIIPEVTLPGGSIDYFLASTQNRKVEDFVGLELQTLDTTGTVWPARQQFLKSLGMVQKDSASHKTYGMNWKMTAKTILVQLHHKIRTFQDTNKHLVLVIQDRLLLYLRKQFAFSHLKAARRGDPMQIHAYSMRQANGGLYRIGLVERIGTNADGIATCLGLQGEGKVELSNIIKRLEEKVSDATLFSIGK